ncbi:MAG: DUF190 domain-containing protein [Gemmataceae bacterium]|nr:DUF190 domain-containing protein [Gemmataceae bacterium]MDW8267457.1 DUF190 domain-containing protein [Gemmataceae bacterium]
MKIETNAKRVAIYVNSTDHWHGRPLYSAVVEFCRSKGIAGATVTRAFEGYGAGHQLHKPKLLAWAENLPVRIEIIDLAERLEPVLPELCGMIGEGLLTLSDVRVIRYLPDPHP